MLASGWPGSGRPIIALAVSAVLVSPGYAYTQFQITCSAPSEPVNFVASPNTRGTFEILWSCIFTIIACTWTIQHLNVPEPQPPMPEDARWFQVWLQDLKWATKSFWTNFKWMVATILAPELIMGKAVGDFFIARRQQRDMKDFATADGVPWTLSHVFFANMGGFEGYIEDAQEMVATEERPSRTDGEIESAQKQPASAEAQLTRPRDPNSFYTLTHRRIWFLRSSENGIDRLPNISAAEINDKSKSNFFVRAVAMIQIAWVIIQAVTRRANGLYISPLELVTAAFAVCAVISYLALLQKPQNVQVRAQPIRIKQRQAAEEAMKDDLMIYLMELLSPWPRDNHSDPTSKLRVFNDALCYSGSQRYRLLVYASALSVGGTLFGVIHLAGWNIELPSSVDQQLWRVSAALMTTLLPVSLLPMFIIGLSGSVEHETYKLVVGLFIVLSWITSLLYSAARVVSLVETFRSLAYLPPGAFASTWAADVPHFG